MGSKEAMLHMIRSVLVILAFILMLAVVIFQCFEINEYGISEEITTRLGSLFASSSSAEQSTAAAPAEQPPAESGESDAPAAVSDSDSKGDANNDTENTPPEK